MYGASLYNAPPYNGVGTPSLGNPIQSLQVQAQTLLQGAVLAMPLIFPDPAPLRVEAATATLLKVQVHTEPGGP